MVEGKGFKYGQVGIGDYCDETKNVAKTCGHYLQLIWATTAYVGCAFNKCTNKGPYARLVSQTCRLKHSVHIITYNETKHLEHHAAFSC